MNKITLAKAVWILCGFYAWGTTMAEFDYRNRTEWPDLNNTSMDNVALAAFTAATGLFGALGSSLLTNFNQHRWELWEKKRGTK